MADLIESGLSFLADQLATHASRSITYARGVDQVTGGLSAVIGRTEFDQTDQEGFVVQHTARDFIVLAADLIIGGQPITPADGDQITETHGGLTRTYEVLSLPSGEVWRWGDAYRNTIRIHTKETAIA